MYHVQNQLHLTLLICLITILILFAAPILYSYLVYIDGKEKIGKLKMKLVINEERDI